jgi:hypothetical protein
VGDWRGRGDDVGCGERDLGRFERRGVCWDYKVGRSMECRKSGRGYFTICTLESSN